MVWWLNMILMRFVAIMILMSFVAIQVQFERVGNLLHSVKTTLACEIGNECFGWSKRFLYYRHGRKTNTPKIARPSNAKERKWDSNFACGRWYGTSMDNPSYPLLVLNIFIAYSIKPAMSYTYDQRWQFWIKWWQPLLLTWITVFLSNINKYETFKKIYKSSFPNQILSNPFGKQSTLLSKLKKYYI